MRKFKNKLCVECGQEFVPASSMSKVCGPVCSAGWGKAVKAAYRASAGGKAWKAAYDASAEGKAVAAVWRATPEAKAAKAAYDATPEAKASKATYAATPEGKAKHKARWHKRRARKACAVFQFWVRVEDHDNSLCYWCGSVEVAHVDHVMPFALGGPAVPSNEVPSCSDCNLKKSAKHPLVWIAELIERV